MTKTTETIDRTFTKGAAKKGKKAVEKKNSVLERLKVEYMPVMGLKPNAYNPNRQNEHDFQLLLRSITEDGFTQPVVAVVISKEHLLDEKFKGYKVGDIVIVDGEHRWRAAQHLGLTEIPVVKVTMTPEQMRIATLRHNRARGSEDIELSAEVLRDLRELGALDWAQDSLMLDDVELNRLLEDTPAPELLASEEFSAAWEPGVNTSVRANSDGVNNVEEISESALQTLRQREAALREAKTSEEKRKIKKDTEILRLELVYSGEDAETIKSVLGDKPARRLLELCRENAPVKRKK
jgi:ParB-like chromosome segregation protein Spo0J